MVKLDNDKLNAYFAGFFDGEGCIDVHRAKKLNSFNKIEHRLRVSIGQIEIKPLKKLKNLYGGNIYKYKKINKWSLHSKEAINFLKNIKPYLLVKRSQANAAIKYEKLLSKPGIKMTKSLFKERDKICFELRNLKDITNKRNKREYKNG